MGASSYRSVQAAPPFEGNVSTVNPDNLEVNGVRYAKNADGKYYDPDGKEADPATLETIMARIKAGDQFTQVQDQDNSQSNLRQEFGMEKAENVIPKVEEQLASDIRFDMFDTVQPGFGNGADNKLFLMQQNHDAKIEFAQPMFHPGSHIGPLAGVSVPPWQLQRVMPAGEVKRYGDEKHNSLNTISNLVIQNGEKSTNLLGDDVGYPYDYSASSLKRKKLSVFEPVIRTDLDWMHVKDPVGVELNKKKFRRLTDSQRHPRHLDVIDSGMGGQHLKKRRGLEVILQ